MMVTSHTYPILVALVIGFATGQSTAPSTSPAASIRFNDPQAGAILYTGTTRLITLQGVDVLNNSNTHAWLELVVSVDSFACSPYFNCWTQGQTAEFDGNNTSPSWLSQYVVLEWEEPPYVTYNWTVPSDATARTTSGQVVDLGSGPEALVEDHVSVKLILKAYRFDGQTYTQTCLSSVTNCGTNQSLGVWDIISDSFLISIPSTSPTESPSFLPTASPTSPTKSPTSIPTMTPTFTPTLSPSGSPTNSPTSSIPTLFPTVYPTVSPSISPTIGPSMSPSISPTQLPSTSWPSESPTSLPTNSPTSSLPSSSPTVSPSVNPTGSSPTLSPTGSPSSSTPSMAPSKFPSNNPTISEPTESPTSFPTLSPTISPTISPATYCDVCAENCWPTEAPTRRPSSSPPSTTSISPPSGPFVEAAELVNNGETGLLIFFPGDLDSLSRELVAALKDAVKRAVIEVVDSHIFLNLLSNTELLVSLDSGSVIATVVFRPDVTDDILNRIVASIMTSSFVITTTPRGGLHDGSSAFTVVAYGAAVANPTKVAGASVRSESDSEVIVWIILAVIITCLIWAVVLLALWYKRLHNTDSSNVISPDFDNDSIDDDQVGKNRLRRLSAEIHALGTKQHGRDRSNETLGSAGPDDTVPPQSPIPVPVTMPAVSRGFRLRSSFGSESVSATDERPRIDDIPDINMALPGATDEATAEGYDDSVF